MRLSFEKTEEFWILLALGEILLFRKFSLKIEEIKMLLKKN